MHDLLSNLCRQYFQSVFPAHTDIYDRCVFGETLTRSDVLPYLGFDLKDGDLPDDIITLVLALIRIRQSGSTDLDNLLEIVEETCKELDGSARLIADLSDFLKVKLGEEEHLAKKNIFAKLFQPKDKELRFEITYSETKLNDVSLTLSYQIGFVVLVSFYLQEKTIPIQWFFAQGKKTRNEIQKNFISRLNNGKLKKLPCKIHEAKAQYLYRGEYKTTEYDLEIEPGTPVTGNPIDSKDFYLKAKKSEDKEALDLLDKAIDSYPLWFAPFKQLVTVLQKVDVNDQQKKRLLKNLEQFSGFIDMIQKNYDLPREEESEVIKLMIQPEIDSWKATLGQIRKILSGSIISVESENTNPLMILFRQIKYAQEFETRPKSVEELLNEQQQEWLDGISEALEGRLKRALGDFEVNNPKITFIMSHMVVLKTLALPNTNQPKWIKETVDFFFELNTEKSSSADTRATNPQDLDTFYKEQT